MLKLRGYVWKCYKNAFFLKTMILYNRDIWYRFCSPSHVITGTIVTNLKYINHAYNEITCSF